MINQHNSRPNDLIDSLSELSPARKAILVGSGLLAIAGIAKTGLLDYSESGGLPPRETTTTTTIDVDELPMEGGPEVPVTVVINGRAGED